MKKLIFYKLIFLRSLKDLNLKLAFCGRSSPSIFPFNLLYFSKKKSENLMCKFLHGANYHAASLQTSSCAQDPSDESCS